MAEAVQVHKMVKVKVEMMKKLSHSLHLLKTKNPIYPVFAQNLLIHHQVHQVLQAHQVHHHQNAPNVLLNLRAKREKGRPKQNQAHYLVQVKIKWIQEIRKNQENQERVKAIHKDKDKEILKEMLRDKDKGKQENHKALEAENHQEKDKALVMDRDKVKAKARDKVQVHQVEAEEENHQVQVQEMVKAKDKERVKDNPLQPIKVEKHQEVQSNLRNNLHF